MQTVAAGGVSFALPDELVGLQATVREFVRTRLEPIGQQIEREDRIPPETIREMGELGLFGIPFPEQYGGLGLGELGYCVAMEELGAVNLAIANLVGGTVSLFGMAVCLDGTPAQKERYLRPVAQGQAVGCFSLTEPGSGSDAASLRTTARRDGAGWRIEGTKQWATNAPDADLFVVFARTEPGAGSRGVTAFILERGTAGLHVGKPDEKMGLRGSHTASVTLAGVWVADEQRLGEPGAGFKTALKTLDGGRVSLAANAVGTAQWLLDRSVAYAKERQQFGQPIGSFQLVKAMLAEMAVGVHAARLMVYHAAWKMDRGERASHEAAMCKLYGTEMVGRAADLAVQVHGGMGYMRALPIERAYRDVRIMRIYEGTNEMQKLLIADHLLA